MKFALAQLRKMAMPHSCDEIMDLSSDLDGFEDIISSKPCELHYIIKERGIDTYLVSFKYKIELIMEDSISLEPVSYLIESSAEEIFTTDPTMDDVFVIQAQTLDTKEAVLTNILIQKPMSVSNEEYYEEIEEESEERINPASASLKDLL